MEARQKARLPVERGLSGVMTAPTDVVLTGPGRNFGDMALGEKYAPGAR